MTPSPWLPTAPSSKVPDNTWTCKFCGCTAANPCRVPGGDECGRLHVWSRYCNAPGCIAADAAERRREWQRELERKAIERKLRELDRKRKRRGKQRRLA